MNKNVIATIKLAPGRVGFFDPLSRIHLTITNPTAHVHSGTNCAALRRNVRNGVLRLVDGSLGGDVPPFKVVNVNGQYKLASNAEEEMKPVFAKEDKKEEVPKQSEEVKVQQDKAEEEIKKALAAEEKKTAPVKEEKEEKAEEAKKEPVKEEKPAKAAAKKTTAAKKTAKK